MTALASSCSRSPVGSPLTADIEALVTGVPGWSPLDELFALSLLVHATAGIPGDIVEVGSWLGRSAIVLGAAAEVTGAAVHCIDLFPARDDWRRNADGSYSFTVTVGDRRFSGYEEQTVWADPFQAQLRPQYETTPDILQGFLTNVSSRGLAHVVTPHRGTSATFAAAAAPDFRARLLFIDGDHGYRAVVEDLDHLLPLLSPGGWICFDDAGSGYEGVDRAVADRIVGNPAFDVARQFTRKCFAARRAALSR